MVERTVSWLSGCRRLHRRYERKPQYFLAFTAIAPGVRVTGTEKRAGGQGSFAVGRAEPGRPCGWLYYCFRKSLVREKE
ncbi:hypothetical protein ABIE67_004889 [Streptomyces sp. V4I8]